MKKDKNVIALEHIEVHRAIISIKGDGELVLNRMNARTVRQLTEERNDNKRTIKQSPNVWEDIITAIHWRDGFQMKDTYLESSEEKLRDMLEHNAPCITGFGLKKSFDQAVVRNEIDTYSTKFDNAVNVVDQLIPIKFASWRIEEQLMSPKKGAPVLARLNKFAGWSADVTISYTDNVYSIDQIVNIINLAGFGLGIGSGRSSGYGRYHVAQVQA